MHKYWIYTYISCISIDIKILMYRGFWKCVILFFCLANHIIGHFEGFSRGSRHFDYKIAFRYTQENLGGQKSLSPLEKFLEIPHYVVCPPKKISPAFIINGALKVIRPQCTKNSDLIGKSRPLTRVSSGIPLRVN